MNKTPTVFLSDRASVCNHRFRMPDEDCPDCGESEGAAQPDDAAQANDDREKCDVCDGVGQLMAWGRYCYGAITCIQCNGKGYTLKDQHA